MNDNLAFQDHILQWLGQTGGTVVVPTRRLANVLRHRCREALRATGRQGWARPKIESLNQLVGATWARTWPDEVPAAEVCRWRVWHDLLGATPPPGHLLPSVELALRLDETYAVLVRNGLEPAGGDGHTPLSGWRARLSREFDAQLAARRLFHPAALVGKLADSILHAQCTLPATLMFAGFASPAPVERQLFEATEARSQVAFLALPAGSPAGVRALSFPDVDQELQWVGKQVVEAAQTSPRLASIGIVLADIGGYQDPIQRVLSDVLGKNPRGGKEAYFNVGLSHSLLRSPVAQAALLPLRLAMEPTRSRLTELILSPYYARWHATRKELANADAIWRTDNLDQAPIADFERSLATEAPHLVRMLAPTSVTLSESIAQLVPSAQEESGATRRSGAAWAAALQETWRSFGFPSFLEPHEQAQLDGVTAVLAELSTELRSMQLTAAQLVQWIEAAMDARTVGTVGDELAGVQVVGLNESRGLWFERVLAPGLTADNLPRPVRRFPLLSAGERERVQGGSAADQFEAAESAVRQLRAMAQQVTLSRPLTSGSEPLPASPFWPSEQEEQSPSRAFWSAPNAAWLRAPWVSQAWRGMRQPPPSREDDLCPGRLPGGLSASKLETLLGCPMKFFAEMVLGLAALDEPFRGIDALGRGSGLHEILQRFVDAVRSRGLSFDTDAAACEALLRETVDAVIGAHGTERAWQVEKRRLLGDSTTELGGLLGGWLASQREHAAEGWQIEKTETAFSALRLADVAFELRGRIDRIDRHPERGLMVWDYKSGQIPHWHKVTQLFIQPQLLTYLAALKSGLVGGLAGQEACAGYWQLKSEKEQGPETYDEDDPAQWQEVLARFESHVAAASRAADGGAFPPTPLFAEQHEKFLRDICAHCDVRTFCACQGELVGADEEEGPR